MNDSPHDNHARPGIADQRAVIALARAVAAGDPQAAALATLAPCPACLAIATMQLGYALAASVAGETFVTEPLLRRLLGLLDEAERELGAAPN